MDPNTSKPNPETHHLTLPDTRTLTYTTHGSNTFKPSHHQHHLLYLHGSPGSPRDSLLFSPAASNLSIRIIAPARPGISTSSPLPNRKITDYPLDIHHLLRHLGLETVDVLAVSAGSPYAFALANSALTKGCIRSVTLVAGVGPSELGTVGMDLGSRMLHFLMRWWPALVLGWVRRCGRARNEHPRKEDYAEEYIERLRGSGAAGNWFWEDEALVGDLRRAVEEAFEQGPEELVYDAGLGCRYWGFKVEDVETEREVRLWYSKSDVNVPVGIGRGLERMLGKARLREFEDEGHMEICVKHAEEILKGVLED